MKFTITDDNTNEVLRIEHLDNRVIDLAIAQGEDVEAVKTDFIVSLNLADNETAHEGNFPQSAYDFDGTTFTHNPKFEYVPPLLRNPESLLMSLVKQLRDSGMAIPLHRDVINTTTDAKQLIDQAAGRARMRLVSPGLLIDQEYALAEKEIKEWRANGSPTNDIPPTLQTWVDATGMTPSDAADDTIAVANQYVLALRTIRHLRLTGKAAVDASTNFVTTAQTYINQLDAL